MLTLYCIQLIQIKCCWRNGGQTERNYNWSQLRQTNPSKNLIKTHFKCNQRSKPMRRRFVKTPRFSAQRHTLHSTLHTPDFTLHTLHSTLHTPHFILHTLNRTLYTPHSTPTLPTSHFTLQTLHSTTPHSPLYTLHSHFTLYTLHSTLSALHSTFSTPHSTSTFEFW